MELIQQNGIYKQTNVGRYLYDKQNQLVLEEVYGNSKASGAPLSMYLWDGREIEVSNDSQEECWDINGRLPRDMVGGVPMLLSKKEMVSVIYA